ncbi:MAG: molybdopterin-dependent oxidoreductase, partial [Dehalococcoidia bacterium]|nr:molybdopterin-dependent oxidoreductase [Dehalococcoidia bacterium]
NGPYLIKKENGRYIRDEATQKPMMWDPIAGQAKPYDATFQDVALEGEYQVQGVACKTTFQALKEHVQQCTPEWAAPITTISAATIRRLAREFGDAARIGSTITIEGHVLPWRPAAIHWYAGISQHTNGYITSMALQMINTVVGNLHVPGGVVGEGTILDYPYGSANLWSGRDSMPTDVDGLFFPSLYARGGGFMQTGYPARKIEPPKTHSAGELFPLSLGVGSAVLEANSLHPESFNHKIPLPKVMLGRHASDMTNKGNPQEMAQILGKIFQISCEPLIDETAEFADIFFPAPMRLERLQVGASFPGYGGATLNLRHFCVNLAQPVLPSPTREMLDIWSELAERLGILSDFNRSINVVW